MPNVKLAVRVRPFTERELKSENDRTSVVNIIDDNTVTITNIKVSVSGAGDSRERVRRYFADYTFNSACPVTDPSYASQEKVFESIGREVVSNVLRGASACVLAYGQSATGKTHTMMGSDTQPGLLPRLCRALADGQPLDINISFLEIYNERVHDLLAIVDSPPTCHSLPRRRGNALKDLRVREHPSRGPYVQNLRRVAVKDLDTLLSLVSEGARRRRTAATKRNTTSSRSHALLELATPRATLYLADLAGSEKASWEGCGGGRQKEGANINKSLVALSNVISALVSGGNRGRFVPYRDSALTWLLKDCFTGGAKTFIIATVSPSVACYGESASTLRWAARARQLPTPRVLNCGPTTASRAALQSQLNQLLAELARNHIQFIPETGKISYDDDHWALNLSYKSTQEDTKIGNIISMLSSNTEFQNSESTASSVNSGSSEVINTMDNNVNIKEEINKEVDKLFGPALERTQSGSDLGVIAPLRNKRRQYKSQEVLPIDKSLQIHNESFVTKPSNQNHPSQEHINEIDDTDRFKSAQVPIMYANQRAEIVASVTERLYSKLKKKEEAAASKMEAIVDKKIVEPLSELRICTNARQRLMELSQKALRNKRRIGIPAYTQTRLWVTRVRDQGIDVQTDLESYILRNENCYTLRRDVATETMPMTSRCKEIAVGPKCGSLEFRDISTTTENKKVVYKNSFMMTDIIVKCDRCSQTPIVPPPRRKKRSSMFTKFIRSDEDSRNYTEECSAPPVISINISQQYPADSETQSSDDNTEREVNKTPSIAAIPPDLLTNHNTTDTSIHENNDSDPISKVENVETEQFQNYHHIIQAPEASHERKREDFPDSEDCSLPRVGVNSYRSVNKEEIKDMILGRNANMYPYNIVLSPPSERDNTKRTVKFKDVDVASAISVASQTSWEWNSKTKCEECNSDSRSEPTNSEKEQETVISDKDASEQNTSDSTDSSKVETNSFIWKKGGRGDHKTVSSIGKGYTPIYKSNARYRTTRSKLYREFLGLQTDENEESESQFSSRISLKDSSESTENEQSQYKFKLRRQFFENKSEHPYNYTFLSVEKNLLDSCDTLDATVNRYQNYLSGYRDNEGNRYGSNPSMRTPKEYLQHLVQLRREVVKAECDTTDSSVGK